MPVRWIWFPTPERNRAIQLDPGLLRSELLRMHPAGWEAKFNEPIPVSKGKPLATLRDAAHYITKLSKADHDANDGKPLCTPH